MIDVLGFWSTVTFFVVMPIWFFGYRITRGILSVAKKNAPEIPMSLRERNAWGTWERKLYPRWAHKMNRCFGGGFIDTGGVAIIGILAFVPTATMLVGAFHPLETIIGLISSVSQVGATVMGWLVVVIASLVSGYIAISKGSRLIGLVQLQEMKDKMK